MICITISAFAVSTGLIARKFYLNSDRGITSYKIDQDHSSNEKYA